MEVTGLEEFIRQPIMNEMVRRGPADAFEPVWLRARGGSTDERGKLMRIRALVPYYRQGFVWHNRSCCGALEAQLTTFPRGRLVDIADAFSYVIEMLELGERYFVAPIETAEEVEESFEELEYDEPLGAEWMRV